MPPKKENPLEQILRTKKLQLEALKRDHLTAIAVFEAKREMLTKDIDFMEQLFYKDGVNK